jgi:hypothetical protein
MAGDVCLSDQSEEEELRFKALPTPARRNEDIQAAQQPLPGSRVTSSPDLQSLRTATATSSVARPPLHHAGGLLTVGSDGKEMDQLHSI